MEIGILGFGTVGKGVYELLSRNNASMSSVLGEELRIKKILVKDLNKHRQEEAYPFITDNPEEILEDRDIKLVVEVMGGIDPTYNYVERAIEKGKNVVTANKDMISAKGSELYFKARENGVEIAFEASVGGGIPIIKPMIDYISNDIVYEISGILNGTSNYIMSRMEDGMDYNSALKEAREKGYAESDPTNDVEGFDARRKLTILSSLAYKRKINVEDIPARGITDIDINDFKLAGLLGYSIKPLAMSCIRGDSIYSMVAPALVEKNNFLNNVRGVINGIRIKGESLGELMFTGAGAGKLPTATAVVGDIMDIIKGRKVKFSRFEECAIRPYSEIDMRFYVRIKTQNGGQAMEDISVIFDDVKMACLPESDDIAFITDKLTEEKLRLYLNNMRFMDSVCNIDKYLPVLEDR
ncbi:MAG: homoserine dehydrogenase [Thermoanaerobacteraceae bacterium]|nr:homoserine dehydrogenase [Thermoanaerobacteraceae bacterium]